MGCYQSMKLRYYHISTPENFLKKAKKFQLMGQITSFTLGKGFTGISNHLILPTLFLIQESTQPYGTGICLQLEWFSEISKSQNWGGGAHSLQCIKGFFAFLCPLNFLFLMGYVVPQRCGHRGTGDLGIPLYEMLVIAPELQQVL